MGQIKRSLVSFFDKDFMDGDVIIPSNKTYFTLATCHKPNEKASLWRFENASMPDALVEACAAPGQMVYSTNSNKLRYFDKAWHTIEK